MSDLSRWSFDHLRDFSTVLSQQGRIDTDADRNEWGAIVARRIQAGALDTIGRSAVPRETPDGFLITAAAGGKLTIGYGRMYVDGILAENHGATPGRFDPHLAEMSGANHPGEVPIPAALGFADQPYAPFLAGQNVPDGFVVPSEGPSYLAYLKVWNREVTSVEDPRLVETALGVDTTARLQTVWQVKVLPNIGANVDCQTPLAEVPGFVQAEPAAGGRLTSKTVKIAGDPNPCEMPATGGYKGLENQLYRVEIHSPGGIGQATFKWSRDNASVASRVMGIPSAKKLVVESVGRDDLLRFSDGDWIEVTDDWRELAGLAGELHQIAVGGGVDDATRTITLVTSLTPGAFPVDANQLTYPARNTRVRRWDHGGRVRDENDVTLVDLDAAGADGDITIPPAGTFVVLEHNIAVAFDVDAAGGQFRTGDYWLIAARTVGASIEILDHAPPLGIHAHYAKLAIVTPPATANSCRMLWPPDSGDDCCDCTVCVTARSHLSGELTLESAIEKVRETGGTVCVGPGEFLLKQGPLRLRDVKSVRIRGQGWATVLHPEEGGAAIHFENAINVVVENLAVITTVLRGGAAVTMKNCLDAALEHVLVVGLATGDSPGTAVALEGLALGVRVTDCLLAADTGIHGGAPDGGWTLTGGVRIQGNAFLCERLGVNFERASMHAGNADVSHNIVLGGREAGFSAVGAVFPGAALNVCANQLKVAGHGIVAGTDALRIAENEVRPLDGEGEHDGIALVPGLDPSGVNRAQILANRVSDMGGHGIAIRTRIESAMIKQNILDHVGGGGVVMDGAREAGVLVVENNQLLDVGWRNRKEGPAAAMRFAGVRELDVRANTVAGFARKLALERGGNAILVLGCDRAHIVSNRLAGVGPLELSRQVTGIGVRAPFREAVIESNSVRRRLEDDDKFSSPLWIGIEVRGPRRDLSPDRPPPSFSALGSFAALNLAAKMVVFTPVGVFVRPAESDSAVAVRGNEVESDAANLPPVLVVAVGGCRATDNRIALLTAPEDGGQPTYLEAVRVIASANELLWPAPDLKTIVLRVRAPGKGDTAVIMGNQPNGRIVLNNQNLNVPWDALNPFVPA